jgi:cysteinyl-tRNA synthetase
MQLHLYDTWHRELRPFAPLNPDLVGLYCCGPTVYDYAHIGNLRTYIFEDLLRRVLQFDGWAVRHVMNITDVGHLVSDADDGEDKMERGSRRSGESARDIAARFTAAFRADLRALGILEPTLWCRATEHLPEQIDFIAELERKGYTYRTDDGIYFDTARQDDYGYLARLQRDGLQAGIRVDVGQKRHPTDFALWKFSPPDQRRQMEWDSPWGRGFPGWHIECSAMATKYLSSWFDIHCGGEDHIAVHHSNEIAQSQACHGTRLANFWLHGAFLQLNETKMSKSTGDFLRLQTLIDRGVDPLAYRYLCLTAHYRRQLNFDWTALSGAQSALERLRVARHGWPDGGESDPTWIEAFRRELHHDLNLPRALAVVWALVKSELDPARKRATLDVMDTVLGLNLAGWQPECAPWPPDIAGLVLAREAARNRRDWAEADALRAKLTARGYAIEDTASGTRLSPAPASNFIHSDSGE